MKYRLPLTSVSIGMTLLCRPLTRYWNCGLPASGPLEKFDTVPSAFTGMARIASAFCSATNKVPLPSLAGLSCHAIPLVPLPLLYPLLMVGYQLSWDAEKSQLPSFGL